MKELKKEQHYHNKGELYWSTLKNNLKKGFIAQKNLIDIEPGV